MKLHEQLPPQPRHELLQVAEVVAREKGIERDEVIVAMEQAILKAAKAKFGFEHDIHVVVDRATGSVTIQKHITVVIDDELENEVTQIPLSHVQKDPDLNHHVPGDVIVYPLPPIEFGRVAAQSARQVIVQKVRDAERVKIFEEFQGRIGHIISGIVKRVEFGNVILEVGRAEAIMKRDDVIPRESFQAGDRIRAYVTEVNPNARGPMISVSRTHPWFMARLFEQEVPEIYDGVIEVKAIARDPGSRAKMAVFSPDHSIDPVGACVGMRGSRVQAVVAELQGEKVDIIPWSSNPATFVVNALAPAEASKVVIDEDSHRVDVVVPEDQLSLAIGRRGQNVRLASQLTAWNIDILTEDQETARRTEENGARIRLFMEALDVDEIIAQLLVAESFTTIEEIASVDLEEFAGIDGFDEDIATELQNRAMTYLSTKNTQYMSEAAALGAEKDLIDLEGLSPTHLIKLVKNGIKTRDDFADLSGDELIEMLADDTLALDQANALIMKAREHWFN
ncbi:MAG: transcription termination factor NusA [Alphaproteobacteria bacterium]|nr:transcription termination factor NusA [Alphaproteobacteria bacterium]